MSQLDRRIRPTWILLDNQSMVDLLSNKNILRNVRKANHNLAVFLTGVKTRTSLAGDLPGYDTMWFQPSGISNILLLYRVANKYRV